MNIETRSFNSGDIVRCARGIERSTCSRDWIDRTRCRARSKFNNVRLAPRFFSRVPTKPKRFVNDKSHQARTDSVPNHGYEFAPVQMAVHSSDPREDARRSYILDSINSRAKLSR